MVSGQVSIKLNEHEAKICNLLKEYCSYFDQSKHTTNTEKSLELRITGGWVRDKLLGKESNDLDIAINHLTGLEFAEGLNEYISTNVTRLGLEPQSIHKIGKNPEKSKHLETATTRLYDLDIDFVNLRNEEYTEHSRIPVIKFGTAVEDAYRRDATLNALFYNIQKDIIEDFTGKGLQDLRDGILRTPLPPFDTFSEDPLRVLRLLRFASTYEFAISQDALKAMKDPQIKQALIRKISRERVGVEMSKMLASKNPEIGLRLISLLNLEDSIFHLFSSYGQQSGSPKSTLNTAIDVVLKLQQTTNLHPQLQEILTYSKTNTHRSTFWLAASLNHWSNTEAYNEKKKLVPAVTLIIRDGLKLSTNEGSAISNMFMNQSQVTSLVNSTDRKELGVLIRKCDQDWPLTVLYAILKYSIEDITKFDSLVKSYSRLVENIYQMDLQNAWNLKPMVNGKEIQAALGSKKGGPWLKTALDQVLELQLENPSISKQQCLELVVNNIKNNSTM